MGSTVTAPFTPHDLVIEVARPIRLSFSRRLAVRCARYALGRRAESMVSSALDSIASRLSERGLALRSLSEIVETQPSDAEIDPDDSLRARLEAMCSDVQDIERSMDALRSHGIAERRVERVAQSARLLREESRSLMGAIQAHDANVSALRRAALRVARTPEEIAAQFDDAFTG